MVELDQFLNALLDFRNLNGKWFPRHAVEPSELCFMRIAGFIDRMRLTRLPDDAIPFPFERKLQFDFRLLFRYGKMTSQLTHFPLTTGRLTIQGERQCIKNRRFPSPCIPGNDEHRPSSKCREINRLFTSKRTKGA